MDTNLFTCNAEILEIINRLKSDGIDEKIISDAIDENNNQYVDLVQEGGGVLGIALLGYTYILEQMGIRFFSLAGTSAGAINTLMLASVGNVDEAKSRTILEILANKNLFDFVDGPFTVRKLFNSILNDAWIGSKVFWGLSVLPHLFKYKGLNPGNNFLDWISGIISVNQINTTHDLLDKRIRPATLKLRKNAEGNVDDLIPKMKIIAADITTESRVIFPEMNKLFWNKPDEVNPAYFLRASMSIPGFFHPFEVSIGDKVKKNDWEEIVKYRGEIPEKVSFVDGGVMSNFPIDVFHNRSRVPRLPTFGVKLGDDRDKANKSGSIPQFLMSIFNSARHVLDFQFLLKNEDYEKLITKIDVGEHNWLNFSISDNDKVDLFIRGAQAAADFLTKFDWEGYKEIRRKMIE
ncbi:MAG: patatin-like phospholipase family protein [Melioribacteraceae bacterium]|nr:patatin-like phospholipase family protein [Melioribacteraceae bacterium]